MRHKYATPAIVLSRSPLSEASSLITLLTSDVGLVRARAQGVRKPGAKMASALQTLVECDVMLLRGKEGWRLAGALHTNDWFAKLSRPARLRAGRIASLLLRLVHGETADASSTFYTIFLQYLMALSELSATATESDEAAADAAECLVALRILHALGVDAGSIPGELRGGYTAEILESVIENRPDFVLRINRGIAASGL
jgi:recombinational DNA repair protein (RecF pathway)